MDAGEFILKLAAAAPSVEEYTNVGLSAKEANEFRQSYFCQPRRTPLAIDESHKVFALMNRWNPSMVEIGMVCLIDAPEETPQGIKIGVVEADPLIIHSDGELAVHELGTPTHVLWAVAKSPDSFLKALALAAKFLADRSVEKIGFEDFDAAKNIALQCATAAGGKRYLDFYLMLLGAE